MLSRTSRAASGRPAFTSIRSSTAGSVVRAPSSVTDTDDDRPARVRRQRIDNLGSGLRPKRGWDGQAERQKGQQQARQAPHQNACLTRISSA